MVSKKRTLLHVTALCTLALLALTGCEQFQRDKRDNGSDEKKEQNDERQDDRWTRRTMPGDKEWGQPRTTPSGGDRWGRRRYGAGRTRRSSHEWQANPHSNDDDRDSNDRDDQDRDTSRRWGQRRHSGNGYQGRSDGRDEAQTAPNEGSDQRGRRAPNGNGSRSSSEGWHETRRPQRDERSEPTDNSSREGDRRPAGNGSRSSSEGWHETRRPQRDDKTAPDAGPARWGERRPSGNGSRSRSDGWQVTFRPTRPPSDERAPAQVMVSRENLAQVIEKRPEFDTLVKALKESGLLDTLEGRGPFTLFAPSDAAFSALPAGKLDDLMKPENRNELRELLSYHIVSGKLSTEQIGKMRALRSLQGQTLTISVKSGDLYIDDAEVSASTRGSNGVVHTIDKVLMPE